MGKENHYGDKWPLGLKPASPKRAPRLKKCAQCAAPT